MKYYVYCLLFKGEHRPFYVGATHNPIQRKWHHSQRITLRKKPFDLVVVETLYCVADTAKLETELISWYRTHGVTLWNAPSAGPYVGKQRQNAKPTNKHAAYLTTCRT